jgi:uncharacterized protein YecE (DUF72 family)
MAEPGTIRVGTSGWQHKHWQGVFYPRDLPADEWLACYARRFNCVQVQSSFYAMPESADISAWCNQVPEDFVFAVKAPRQITHAKKLKNCAPELDQFFQQLNAFGKRLGPVLFHLPTRWRVNQKRLQDFLQRLPAGYQVVFEFTDPSWHNDAIHALLASHGIASCIFEADGVRAPLIADSDPVYLRLHGPGGSSARNYRAPQLRAWVDRAAAWSRRSKEVFLIFDNDESAYAAKSATRTLGLLDLARDTPAQALISDPEC